MILSSTVIKDILRHYTNDPGKAAIYFYFDFKDPQKQSAENMIRALVTQLSRQYIRIPSVLESVFASSNNGQSQPSDRALLDVLRYMYKDFPATYIVIDALDECKNRENLMAIIKTITSWQLAGLHLVLTSRKEQEIEDTLKSLVDACNIIPLGSKVMDQDIQRYVHQRILDDKKLRKWQGGDIQREIEVALIKGAQGM
jgi:hypothetical protein